jgi:hypothetical protein
MPLEGLPEDIAGNAALGGFENLEGLARGYLDVSSQVDPAKWKERLPDDLKADPSLTFNSVEDLARGFVATKGVVGRKRAMPGDDATESEWDAYYQDIGRPEKPEQYELGKPAEFPKQYYSADLEGAYRTLAHKYGLTPKQAKGIYEGYMKTSQEMVAALLKAEADAKGQAEADLRKEWGSSYEEKLAAAKLVIQAIGGKDPHVAESLARKDPVWNHPALARFLANIGLAMRESDLIKGAPGAMKGTLQEEANRLMRSEAYLNDMHADHKATVKRVSEIYSAIHGTGKEEE